MNLGWMWESDIWVWSERCMIIGMIAGERSGSEYDEDFEWDCLVSIWIILSYFELARKMVWVNLRVFFVLVWNWYFWGLIYWCCNLWRNCVVFLGIGDETGSGGWGWILGCGRGALSKGEREGRDEWGMRFLSMGGVWNTYGAGAEMEGWNNCKIAPGQDHHRRKQQREKMRMWKNRFFSHWFLLFSG